MKTSVLPIPRFTKRGDLRISRTSVLLSSITKEVICG